MDSGSASGNGIERTMPVRSLRLLGGFDLLLLSSGEKVSSLGKRERVLLAFLALSPNCRASRLKLAALLWGDASDETATDNLRTSVFNLRKALGDNKHRIIARDGDDIVLDANSFEIDAVAFRRLVGQSGRNEMEAAAKLYAGDFLNGLNIDSEDFETWRREEQTRFRDQTIDVLTRLMKQCTGSGDTEAAVKAGTRLLEIEPLHEPAVCMLMRLYAESGRRSAAIDQYRRLSGGLRAELDAEPEAETRAVFAALSRGERVRATGAADVKPEVAPASARTERTRQRSAVSIYSWSGASIAAVAVLLGILFQFGSWEVTSTRPQAAIETPQDASSTTGGISVAVLPFANLSGDASQAFLSDGMTEELITALARVPDLRVVARESVFQLKGQNSDIGTISQQLHAPYVIAGSVRRSGNRVRVTAQLIKADDGRHIWADSYDRELTDLFTIQEEIARSIAGELRVPLGLREGKRLVSNRTEDTASYYDYLRAKALFRARGLARLTEAARLLEQVVARNPNFAPAWALMAEVYDKTPAYHPLYATVEETRRVVDESLPRAEMAAQRAIELDSELVDGYIALGLVQRERGKFLSAEGLFKQALALDPNNPEGMHFYGEMLGSLGYLNRSLAMLQHLRTLEPFVPVFALSTALVFAENGQSDTALEMLRAMSPDDANRLLFLPIVYAAKGRYGEAADALLSAPSPFASSAIVEEAARLLRAAPSTVTGMQTLPDLGYLGYAYLYAGAPDRVLEAHEVGVQVGYSVPAYNGMLWHPAYAPVRKGERFKRLVRNGCYVDYWRARGWPDLCRPVGADDFVCD